MTQSHPTAAAEDSGSLSRRQLLLASALGATATGIEASGVAAALDDATELAWERDVDAPTAPGALGVPGAGTVVLSTNPLQVNEHAAIGLDLETGEQRWSIGIDAASTLWSVDGTLYEQGDRTLTAIDPTTGEQQWLVRGAFESQFYVENGMALFGGGTDQPTIVDLDTGEIPWELEGFTFNDAVGIDAERVVCYGDGELAAFGVGEGTEHWRLDDLPEGRFTVEAYSDWPDGFIVDTQAEETVVVDLENGEHRYTLERAVALRRIGTENGDVVVFVDDDTVERLDPSSGEPIWEQSVSAEDPLLVEVALGLVVVASDDQFWALSQNDGSIVYQDTLDGPFRSVQGHDGSLFATGSTTTEYESDGEAVWSARRPSEGGAFPAIADDYLVTVAGGTVYAFALDGDPVDPGTTEPTTTPETTPPTDATTVPDGTTESGPTTGDDSAGTDGDPGTAGDDGTTGEGTPGFGALAAALGIGGLAEYLRRIQSDDAD